MARQIARACTTEGRSATISNQYLTASVADHDEALYAACLPALELKSHARVIRRHRPKSLPRPMREPPKEPPLLVVREVANIGTLQNTVGDGQNFRRGNTTTPLPGLSLRIRKAGEREHRKDQGEAHRRRIPYREGSQTRHHGGFARAVARNACIWR